MQVSQKHPVKNYGTYILLFVALKLALNLLAAGHYGFQRDEMLHLTLGDHLDWGYMEVPPLIALLAKISTAIFGDAVFAARVFPAVASALMVWFTGLLVAAFGGRRFAIALACLCIIFSPGMAASGYLFQPVVFDQLWWLLAAYCTVKYVKTRQPKYMYWLGAVTGMGLLTKYTMAFFTGALLLGLLFTPQRRLLWRKEVLVAAGIALLLFLPNILWQYAHHWPVATHMTKLQHQQLEHVKPADFMIQQVLLHGAFFVVWIMGLLCLLFHQSLRQYRFIAFAYIFVFGFLLKMNGKAYYLLAAYPMLFAAGGYGIMLFIKNTIARGLAVAVLILPNLPLLPIVLPVLPLKQALGFFEYNRRHLPMLDFAVTWEDQQKHRTTQDYADMLGWDEIVAKTAAVYHGLSPAQQRQTIIFADNYGEAAALHVYRKRYRLPEVVCLNSSFALWAPDTLRARYIIYVSDDNDVSDLRPVVEGYKRKGQVQNPLAREHGTGIFLIIHPKPMLENIYRKHRQQSRLE